MGRDEVAEIESCAENIRTLLTDIFVFIPRTARSISGFGSFCGINISTSRRFVKAAKESKSGIDAILTLPGPDGLEKIASGLNTQLRSVELEQYFTSLIQQFQELIFTYARSHAELKRKLTLTVNREVMSEAEKECDLRRRLFQENSELIGESVEHYLGIHCVSESQLRQNLISNLTIASCRNVALAHGARPYLQTFSQNSGSVKLSEPQFYNGLNYKAISQERSCEFVLKCFSQENIEAYYSGIDKSDNAIVFSPPTERPNKFTFACGRFEPSFFQYSTGDDTLVSSHSIACRSPGKRLTLIVLLENRLAKKSIAKSACYPSSVNAKEIIKMVGESALEQLIPGPDVRLFNPMTHDFNKTLETRGVNEIIHAATKLKGDDVANYTGYYIDVDYPTWLSTYHIHFEF